MKKGNIADLTPDPINANAGTERGTYMLTESMQRLGVGRSVLVDKHGTLIAGNKSHATAGAIGIEDTVVVNTTGDRLVVVQRDDLDLSAPTSSEAYQKARELSIADNRSSEVGLSWDASALSEYIGEGVELDSWFLPDELETILSNELSQIDGDNEEGMSDRPDKEIDCTCPNCGEKFVRTL
jgi:hypothetical protein